MSETEVVAIEAGQPCFRCGNPVDKQEQEPFVVHCEDCGVDHLWHGNCVPEELKELHRDKRA